MLLDHRAITAAQDEESEIVEVPEWGGSVKLVGLSGAERDLFDAWRITQRESRHPQRYRNTRAWLVAHCLRDEQGKRIFGDQDLELLGAKSGKVLDRLYGIALRLSGIGEEGEEDAKKKSPDTSEDSGTDSV
jgi:hypothetical protein